ncbi:hypothetical protein GHSM17_39 [Vibrio phage vB_VpaP_GHSM17]|uniref:Peptidase n=1 Tax=Vibrio phage vB_VpaP_GHSM17 TaxID=2911515 RepID=A0AAE9KQN6_9CAUD|nr:hypothetical protein GHSM17_39 [Vibrio phage vB_VpaP_GHSM17]
MTNPNNTKAFELLLAILSEERPGLRGQEVVAEVLDAEGIEYSTDRHGNMFVQVGERDDIMFTSHTDTVDFDATSYPKWLQDGFKEDADELPSPPKKKKLCVLNGHLALDADGVWDCLGADDGAGVVLMIMMIKQGIQGQYWFFAEEEVGRVGSTGAYEDDTESFEKVKWCISFDRRGTDIIHTQIGGRCASDEFVEALAERFDRPKSRITTGVYTDSATFIDTIPECTNIGVGYYSEHTDRETLNLNEFYDTLEHCLKPETWAELPVGERPTPKPVPWIDEDFDLDDYLNRLDNATDIDEVLLEFGAKGELEMLEWVQTHPLLAASILYLAGNQTARGCIGKDIRRAVDDEGRTIDDLVRMMRKTIQ